eukprot:2239337-Prymnesium_polylepis.1
MWYGASPTLPRRTTSVSKPRTGVTTCAGANSWPVATMLLRTGALRRAGRARAGLRDGRGGIAEAAGSSDRSSATSSAAVGGPPIKCH